MGVASPLLTPRPPTERPLGSIGPLPGAAVCLHLSPVPAQCPPSQAEGGGTAARARDTKREQRRSPSLVPSLPRGSAYPTHRECSRQTMGRAFRAGAVETRNGHGHRRRSKGRPSSRARTTGVEGEGELARHFRAPAHSISALHGHRAHIRARRGCA